MPPRARRQPAQGGESEEPTARKAPAKKSAAPRKTAAAKKAEAPAPKAAAEDAPPPMAKTPVKAPVAAPEPAARPLKVVARLHAYGPGHNAGAEQMAHSLLRALVARGHQVEVWLTRYTAERDPYEVDGVQVYPLRARHDGDKALRQADVVVAHLETVPAAGALARAYGRPLAVLCHNERGDTLKNLTSGQAALAVYNSQWVEGQAEAWLDAHRGGHRPEASVVVRPLVDAAEYTTTPGDRVTLVNCAAVKGGQVLYELAQRLPDTKFLAVRGAYGQQVDYTGLDNVEVLEHLPGDQMRDEVFARTRVLLMPSVYESWGRVGTEALASGIPVIAHQTPGLEESLGEAGIFVDRADVAGWEKTLRGLLEDDDVWAAASSRAKARSAELDPAADLSAWCAAVEALAPTA